MNGRTVPEVVTEIPAPASGWDPFLSIPALVAYSSLSERMLRGFLRDPEHPLPHFRIGARVLVRRSDFDAWMQVFRHGDDVGAETIVARILDDLDARPRATHSRTA
jgi:hypothetical protein